MVGMMGGDDDEMPRGDGVHEMRILGNRLDMVTMPTQNAQKYG